MKRTLFSAALAFLAVPDSYAASQFDLKTFTCADVAKLEPGQIAQLFHWTEAYAAGQAHSPTGYFDISTIDGETLGKSCSANPGMLYFDAWQKAKR
jgi:hypothetical protein